MDKFVPKEKLSKKEKRALDQSQRQSWSISPVTRACKDCKVYVRTVKTPVRVILEKHVDY